jgi:nucleoside 2-deoxyribosyltransferase
METFMKIYFSCSITGGRNEESIYQRLVETMEGMGHEVPTAHLASPEVMKMEKVVLPEEIFTRDMAWLEESDVVVAEVSTPSHGVGYEVAVGLLRGKPVFCCYQAGKRVSKIITGNTSQNLTQWVYSDPQEAVSGLKNFLSAQEKALLH